MRNKYEHWLLCKHYQEQNGKYTLQQLGEHYSREGNYIDYSQSIGGKEESKAARNTLVVKRTSLLGAHYLLGAYSMYQALFIKCMRLIGKVHVHVLVWKRYASRQASSEKSMATNEATGRQRTLDGEPFDQDRKSVV